MGRTRKRAERMVYSRGDFVDVDCRRNFIFGDVSKVTNSLNKTHITERSAVAILMSWMREIIEKNNLDLGLPNVETSGKDNKFPDMEIYESRRSENCLCLFEAKRPSRAGISRAALMISIKRRDRLHIFS